MFDFDGKIPVATKLPLVNLADSSSCADSDDSDDSDESDDDDTENTSDDSEKNSRDVGDKLERGPDSRRPLLRAAITAVHSISRNIFKVYREHDFVVTCEILRVGLMSCNMKMCAPYFFDFVRYFPG